MVQNQINIPFNKPFITGNELSYIDLALKSGHLSGDGYFTKKCSAWLENYTSAKKVLLTQSCTAALEMAAILINIQSGDEVIMPSYTFVSTANAFVLRGATPVFVDIKNDNLNINEQLIIAAITPRTKAIVVVHYAGVACEMNLIMSIAKQFDLFVIEDSAQAAMSTYHDRQLGSIGHLGCFSFHETKNLISGEGGALLINDLNLVERAEIIREKGTNRSQFFRGDIDKYTWMDIGSSYLPSEITAAVLYAQLESSSFILDSRLQIWNKYNEELKETFVSNSIQYPFVPKHCEHNGHMYYILLGNLKQRTQFISRMKSFGIHCVFHYVPLHTSPFGEQYCNAGSPLHTSSYVSDRIVRLPIWIGLEKYQDEIINLIKETIIGL